MLRAILVDDENLIREGISNFIDWHSLGLELIGQAANGQEAADLILVAAPEIIITDVKMPLMDGIEILALAKKTHPDCVVIMISSYDEFEYAQQAVNLGAFAYLLKPIDTDRLIGLLREAVEKLTRQTVEKRRLEEAETAALENKLKVLAFGGNTDILTGSEREYLDSFSGFSALTVYLGTPVFHTEAFGKNLEDQLQKWIEDRNQEAEIRRIQTQSGMLTYCVFHKTEQSVSGQDLIYIYQQYYRGCVLGISERRPSISHFHEICQQSENAVEYRFFTEDSIIHYENIRGREEILHGLPDWNAGLREMVKAHSREKTESFVDDIFRYIVKQKMSMVMINAMTASLLTEMIREIREAGGRVEDLFLSVPDMISSVLYEKNLNVMKERLKEILWKAVDYISGLEELRPNSVIYKAKCYILDHYQDASLRLEDVAEHVYISPSYFSTIFNREMKISFGNYLTQVRMERAKQLLKTSHLKIYQIAEQTGYQNVSWFTVAFKKYTGKSPGEYRKCPKAEESLTES